MDFSTNAWHISERFPSIPGNFLYNSIALVQYFKFSLTSISISHSNSLGYTFLKEINPTDKCEHLSLACFPSITTKIKVNVNISRAELENTSMIFPQLSLQIERLSVKKTFQYFFYCRTDDFMFL